MSSRLLHVPGASLTMVIVYAVATFMVGVAGVMGPEHRYASALMFLLGLSATWRQYLNWRRNRQGPLVR